MSTATSPSLPRSRQRRQGSTSSSIALSPSLRATDDSPYPPDMPRPEMPRHRSSMSVASMSKEDIKNMEALINGYEAEEEMIMNKLSRRLDELRRHEVSMSMAMEVESENIVNRLQRQLRVVQGQLAAAQAGSGSTDGGSGQAPGKTRSSDKETGFPNAVGLQAFLSGSDPVVMGNAVEALRAEKAEMQHRIDSLSNDNDSLRQELIDLRRRLGIPVDDLVGLGGNKKKSASTLHPALTNTMLPSNGEPLPSQPISFNRQSANTTGFSTSTSSSSDAAQSPLVSYSAAETGATSFSPSPFGSASQHSFSYAVPPPPANTFASPSAGYYNAGGRIVHPAGTGGMPLTYPSVPPPSLSTSLTSTSAVSPAGSPTHSRRPSLGRIAETGSFARGRVESFGVGGGRSLRDRSKGEVVEEEALED